MRTLKIRYVKSVGRGHWQGMNPLTAEALKIKCPRGTIIVEKTLSNKAEVVKHEQHEYALLKKIKAKKKHITRSDYLKAHHQTIVDGYL